MSEPRFKARNLELNDKEWAMHSLAISTLQAVLGARIVAVVHRDEQGLAITVRPGEEIRILSELSLADWGAMVRSVEDV